MKHVIANPHNGSLIEHDGLSLEPGQQVHLNERDAEALKQRFGFLLHLVVEKAPAKLRKVVPLKGTLEWEHANHGTDEVPEHDIVQHVVSDKPAPKRAAKKTATPRTRKAAK